MSTTETERYVRITLLTFEGGLWISKKILFREIDRAPGSPTLDDLLLSKKPELTRETKRGKITKRQYETLFPTSEADTDVEEWDLSLLIKIVLFLFENSLPGQESYHLSELLRIRNEVVCHARQPSVQEQEFNTLWTHLTWSICGLASAFDVNTQQYGSDLVQRLSGRPLDLQSSTKRVAQLCRDDEHMEQSLKRLNEVATGAADANRKLDDVLAGVREIIRTRSDREKDVCHVDIPLLNSTVCLTGKNDDEVKLAQDILFKVHKAVIDKVDNPDDGASVRDAVQQFLADIDAGPDVGRFSQGPGKDGTPSTDSGRSGIDDLQGVQSQSVEKNTKFTHPIYTAPEKTNIKNELQSKIELIAHGIRSIVLRELLGDLIKQEGTNCVEVFPAYRKCHKDDPLFVVLSKNNIQAESHLFHGFDIYRRKYDQVSPEAERVARHDGDAYLSWDDQDRVRKAIHSAELHKKHSNITIISASPYKSKQNGDDIKECVCIVIHCLLKGFIPFDEEAFPETISGIPVDVREGYFQLGVKPSNCMKQNTPSEYAPMMDKSNDMSGVQSTQMDTADNANVLTVSNSSTIGQRGGDSNLNQNMDIQYRHVGLKSKDFNTRLLMGSCIAPLGGKSSGTLGGFVALDNEAVAALTCNHVIQIQGSASDAILQPAEHNVIAAMSSERCVFGKVHTCSKAFKEGSLDKAGVDAATIEITKPERTPQAAQFIKVQREQLMFAGFDPDDPPQFSRGQILRVTEIKGNDRRTSVVKFGAESGLTVGLLHLYGGYVRTVKQKMELRGATSENFEFFDQLEVLSIKGTSTNFFELGDSGSLLFMPLQGTELHCIGMCIGCTNYSCIVTPIENVFDELKITGFKNFTGQD